MDIYCCDKCGAALANGDPGQAQVMGVSMTVHIESWFLEAQSPPANDNMIFCSAKCAVEYLAKFVKLENGWLKTWQDGKILGKKKIYSQGRRM